MVRQTENIDESGKRLTLGAREMERLAEEIIESRALGRSKVYASLLRYLVSSAIRGTSPKEIEVAIDVLGRDTDFDVTRDAAVRVYIHQLRKKLDQYYENHDVPCRLLIPKGEYTVEVIEQTPAPDNPATRTDPVPPGARPERRHYWAVAATVLLAANLMYWLATDRWSGSGIAETAGQHPTWAAVLDDDVPILVVMGDYYIFAELDDAGNRRCAQALLTAPPSISMRSWSMPGTTSSISATRRWLAIRRATCRRKPRTSG